MEKSNLLSLKAKTHRMFGDYLLACFLPVGPHNWGVGNLFPRNWGVGNAERMHVISLNTPDFPGG